MLTEKPKIDLTTIRIAIQQEFVNRCRKNRSYSLRAYAKFLELDQSLLSKIMRDERKLSQKTALRIRTKLGLRLTDIASFKGKGSETYLPLADDEFSAIADWYHFAILELLKIKRTKINPDYIAKKLNIHIEEVRVALSRLQRLGMIRLENKRITLVSKNNSWSNNSTTTEARKILQKQLLEKSLIAIDDTPYAERDHGSLTVAISKKRLPEFKKRLMEIRRELGSFLQSGEEADEIYQLQTSFFPLTKSERNLT